MKAAPLFSALKADGHFDVRLIHTGQHFDENMSEVFFTQLGLPKPSVYLNVNQVSAVTQIALIMLGLEKEFVKNPTDLVVVFGDVNSTLAGALTANKLGLRLAHVEAGLRSFDPSMPEEHNRIVTDMLSDLLFTPSQEADRNLRLAGVPKERIFRVGNIMVDSLLSLQTQAKKLEAYKDLGLEKQNYSLITLHRPSNVDDSQTLKQILTAIDAISSEMPVIFPVHPRTQAKIGKAGYKLGAGVKVLGPQSYLEFINLMMNARMVLTDSGGIQEESTVLGLPCLTLRENTERPITVNQGSNQLVGTSTKGIVRGFQKALRRTRTKRKRPELWDGKTAQRIVRVLRKEMSMAGK